MIQRLQAENNPNFFLLKYTPISFEVRTFLAIPKAFFVPGIIEKRKPLAHTARRRGWVGCNILMQGIPELGKIFYVQDGNASSKGEVLMERWTKTEFVRQTEGTDAKGWLLDVLLCVERLHTLDFSLEDVYRFETDLRKKHPDNHNVRAKVRQQLQLLRDRGIIDFAGRGKYSLKYRGA